LAPALQKAAEHLDYKNSQVKCCLLYAKFGGGGLTFINFDSGLRVCVIIQVIHKVCEIGGQYVSILSLGKFEDNFLSEDAKQYNRNKI
jgi:hypothetical protein